MKYMVDQMHGSYYFIVYWMYLIIIPRIDDFYESCICYIHVLKVVIGIKG